MSSKSSTPGPSCEVYQIPGGKRSIIRGDAPCIFPGKKDLIIDEMSNGRHYEWTTDSKATKQYIPNAWSVLGPNNKSNKGTPNIRVCKPVIQNENDNGDLQDWELLDELVETPKMHQGLSPKEVNEEVRKAVDEVKHEYQAKFAAIEAQQMGLLRLYEQQKELETELRKDIAQRALENQRMKAKMARQKEAKSGSDIDDKLAKMCLGDA